MNLDAISRAANENTDPDPSDRDFGELMANALRVCLDDLLANRGPMTDEQRKAMFARMEGGGGGDRFGNRSSTTLLETAVRVARTPDAVLANARRPLTDDQKRAIFAKERNGRPQTIQAGPRNSSAPGSSTASMSAHSIAGSSMPDSMKSVAKKLGLNPDMPRDVYEAIIAGAQTQVPAWDQNGFPLNMAAKLQSAGISTPSGGAGPQILSPASQGYRQGSSSMPVTQEEAIASGNATAGKAPSGTSRPQYDKQTGQLVYPGNRITTKPTPPKPAAPAIHEKMNPPKRPARSTASLAKALQKYK